MGEHDDAYYQRQFADRTAQEKPDPVCPTDSDIKLGECVFCTNDVEQCHRDLNCEARAWRNGFCGPHQPNPKAYH